MKTNDVIIELVKKLKKGDNAAFTDLYNETYKYLHTCVIHIVKDEDVTQDMLQDAYVEIYKNIGQLKDEAGFLGWAATIANRKCFAYLKKNKDLLVDEQTDDEGNETDYFDTIADDEAFIPENILDNQEKIKIIRGIIDDLTDVQRACVIGFYYNEQKQDEIANELGLPVNTVKSHLNRAKAKIKEAVGDTERKQGIKLYSIAPFMLLFFLKDTEVYAAELAVPAMSAGLSSAVSGSTAAGSTAATGAKTAGMAIKTKVIAGIVAGAVIVGGIAGMSLHKEKKVESEVIEEVAEKTIVEEISEIQETEKGAEKKVDLTNNENQNEELLESDVELSDSEIETTDKETFVEKHNIQYTNDTTFEVPYLMDFTDEDGNIVERSDFKLLPGKSQLTITGATLSESSEEGYVDFVLSADTTTTTRMLQMTWDTKKKHYNTSVVSIDTFFDKYTGAKALGRSAYSNENYDVTYEVECNGEICPVSYNVTTDWEHTNSGWRENGDGEELAEGLGYCDYTSILHKTVVYHFPKEYDGLILAIRNREFDEHVKKSEEVSDTISYMFEPDEDGDILSENDFYYVCIEELLKQFN